MPEVKVLPPRRSLFSVASAQRSGRKTRSPDQRSRLQKSEKNGLRFALTSARFPRVVQTLPMVILLL
jgi:hypothetical protein